MMIRVRADTFLSGWSKSNGKTLETIKPAPSTSPSGDHLTAAQRSSQREEQNYRLSHFLRIRLGCCWRYVFFSATVSPLIGTSLNAIVNILIIDCFSCLFGSSRYRWTFDLKQIFAQLQVYVWMMAKVVVTCIIEDDCSLSRLSKRDYKK